LPFWDTLRRRTGVQSALRGVNAAVVGLLLAALYKPIWTSAIFRPADFAIGILAFLLLAFWAVPPWLVVIFGAAAASIVSVMPRLNG
jgi:chromate transporter